MDRFYAFIFPLLLFSVIAQAVSDPVRAGYSAFKREAWDEAIICGSQRRRREMPVPSSISVHC